MKLKPQKLIKYKSISIILYKIATEKKLNLMYEIFQGSKDESISIFGPIQPHSKSPSPYVY